MAEAHKINDGLYVVPLGDGKVQLRSLIQKDEDKEEWRCKNLSRQDTYKLMSFLRNEVLYLC
jgi:hypothetical protein|nr:MAG TPA: hypothetical protein [Caudoviricetes sp.]